MVLTDGELYLSGKTSSAGFRKVMSPLAATNSCACGFLSSWVGPDMKLSSRKFSAEVKGSGAVRC